MLNTESSPSIEQEEVIFRWDGSATWLTSKVEAKNKIESLFIKQGELGYDDIVFKLGFDLKVIMEICEELEKEGKIKTIFK